MWQSALECRRVPAKEQEAFRGPKNLSCELERDLLCLFTYDVKILTQHILKKSAQEARAWGQATYSQLTPAQKKHIHDRVMAVCFIYLFGLMKWLPLIQIVAECPSLHGHETMVDRVLSKCLIQAKHYIARKARETIFSNILRWSRPITLFSEQAIMPTTGTSTP